ncbi:hypothetical protein HDV03_002038 [Kappamyces sp. JEL0829]|nr:hypothetical protein HDV03_002038 [Kappamyces sp. JEL0829]
MGHVDHGKTTLLDSLRKTSVAAGEAGGITQHIGAFSVVLPSQKTITFLDTPGHAAFSHMRKRGAQVTDIVVLVVAADDGIMPQTIEAIQHSLKAQVPIVVAINKCDKPGVDPQKIKESLLRHEVIVEDMGGEVPAVNISGKTGLGLEELEETILAIAEIADYRGDPTGLVEGIIVEAKLSKQFGNVATMIVQRGTLRPGAIVVAGNTWCRVRRMIDEYGRPLTSAGPSSPVEVLGWKELPDAGDVVLEADSEGLAKRVISNRKRREELQRSAKAIEEINEKRTLQKALVQEAKEKEDRTQKKKPRLQREEKTEAKTNELRVIVKGDVHGSVEAIEGVIGGLPSHEVYCEVVSSGVGTVTESDVEYARVTNAMIYAFNVPVHRSISNAAEESKVTISSHNVIYTLVDSIKAEMSKLLVPERVTNVVGEAAVQAIFGITIKKKVDNIAGCKILNGKITRQGTIRVVRNGEIVHEGSIKTFKHHKKDILEASKGLECGIAIEGFSDVQEGDTIQSISIVEKPRFIE